MNPLNCLKKSIMHWFICFAVYMKKINMWFGVLNILWIFYQKKNYVVQSAEKELNLNGKGSHKKLRVACENPLNPNTGEHDSCMSYTVENVLSSLPVDDVDRVLGNTPSSNSHNRHLRNVLSSLTVYDVDQVLGDTPSSNSHTRHLGTTILKETLNEGQSNRALPFVNATLSETEEMGVLTVSNALKDKIEKELLNDTMIFESTMSQPLNIERTLNNFDVSDILNESDELDDEIEEKLLHDMMLFQSTNSQSMDNEGTSNNFEGSDMLSESDELDDEIEEKLLHDMMLFQSTNSQSMDNEGTSNNFEGSDMLSESDELDDEIEEKLLHDMMLFQSANSQSMDNEVTLNNTESSDMLSNLGALNKDMELQLLDEIKNSFIHWDSCTLEKYVKDALKVLPEAEDDSNNRSENISCHQLECYTEDIPSMSGIQLKGVGFQNQEYVDNVKYTIVTFTNVTATNVTSISVTATNVSTSNVTVTDSKVIASKVTATNIASTNVTFTNVISTNVITTNVISTNVAYNDALEKEAIKKMNDGNTGSAISSQPFTMCQLASSKQYIDIEFIKKITEKLISDLELHRHIEPHTLDTSIAMMEKWSTYNRKLEDDFSHINIGGSKVLQLFLYIITYVQKLKFFDNSGSVPDFLNSSAIFRACCACLLGSYHRSFTNRIYKLKKRLLSKKNTILRTMEAFLKIDEPKTYVNLNPLLIFHCTEHNCVVECVLKWVFCLVKENSPFGEMQQNLTKYHKRLKSLYSFISEFKKIYEDEKKDVDKKAEDLKKILESYVAEMNSFMSALEEEQQNLIKEVSHTFSNVEEVATFLFYNLGKILLILLSVEQKQKNTFLFIIAALNALLIACKNNINCESDFTKEVSALLKEKECLLQAPFWNMFLWIHKALISKLKILAETILKDINKEKDKLGKLNVNGVLEMTANLTKKVHVLEHTEFSVLLNIINKKEQLEQHEMICSKSNEIHNTIRTLSHMTEHRNWHNRKEKLKANASTFKKIMKDFNSLFKLVGIKPLDPKKLEQLKIYEKIARNTNPLSESEAEHKRKKLTSRSSSS